MAQEVEERIKDPTDQFLEEITSENDNNNEKGGSKSIVTKKATIQLTEKEYMMMQLANINISKICTKLLRNHLNSKPVQENVKTKLGVINDYFEK